MKPLLGLSDEEFTPSMEAFFLINQHKNRHEG